MTAPQPRRADGRCAVHSIRDGPCRRTGAVTLAITCAAGHHRAETTCLRHADEVAEGRVNCLPCWEQHATPAPVLLVTPTRRRTPLAAAEGNVPGSSRAVPGRRHSRPRH